MKAFAGFVACLLFGSVASAQNFSVSTLTLPGMGLPLPGDDILVPGPATILPGADPTELSEWRTELAGIDHPMVSEHQRDAEREASQPLGPGRLRKTRLNFHMVELRL